MLQRWFITHPNEKQQPTIVVMMTPGHWVMLGVQRTTANYEDLVKSVKENTVINFWTYLA